MSDSYYELLDAVDELGEKFLATDMVRSAWSAAIQHAAPVSALLVRGLERCEQRDDTRLSRVLVDLLGGVPAEGDLWVRSRIERSGKQIELVSAEMLAADPHGEPRPVAKASGWRLKTVATAEIIHAPAPPLRPLSETHSRGLADRWDRNYVHSIEWRWLTHRGDSGPGESWLKPTVDLVKGENMTPLERLFTVADDANGIGTTIGTLFDETGAVGAIQQSVLVRPRPTR